MKKRITVAILTVIGVIFLVGILMFVETGWPLARFKGGISIPETATLKTYFEADPLDPTQALTIRELFGQLVSVEMEINTVPDLELWVHNEGEMDKQYSIWISEKFVYDGHFLGAWTERMTSDKAKGFRLSKGAVEFLKTIK